MIDLATGVRLGSYELVSLIGRTGMSEVWSAHDREGKIVALKTISSRAGDDPQLRARFLREGGEHQLLKHPAIVPILDFFELNGEFYLVMQYIAGGSLEDRLEKNGWKPLPVPEALRIARQILPALDYAHQQMIIHRDVKPSNILLEGDQAFLGDFGIALALARPRLTRVAQVMGTRSYMSPEQIQGSLNMTHLTDVYSFGCVMYEMLTGRQPFPASEGAAEPQYVIDARRVNGQVTPPRQWNPEISPRLERIILTSLAPAPQDRFSGCGSFVRALEGVETDKGTVVPPSPNPIIIPDPLPVPPPLPATPKKRVLAAGNIVAAVIAALAWIPFSGQSRDDFQAIIFLCAIASNIVLLRMFYKAWDGFPAGHGRTTPGQAVGYLFIPFYNLYWFWNVIPGLASDYNQFMQQRGAPYRQSAGLYKFFCIFHCYIVGVAFLLLVQVNNVLSGSLFLLDLMVFIPIMTGIWASAANRLVEVGAQPLATGASGTGQGIR
jgi:serine/threonine protein kinase